MNVSGLVAFLSALVAGGTIGAIVAAIANRRRNSSEADKFTAEAAKIIADAATNMIHERGEMAAESEARLERKIEELEERIGHLSIVVAALTAQLESEGLKPAIPPMPNGGRVI